MNIGTARREERIANEPVEGSISTGTLRPEDLVPRFAAELRRICTTPPGIVMEAECWVSGWQAYASSYPDHAATPDEWQEMGFTIVGELTDKLNSLAPEGLHFGALEGDGADFGFWSLPELEVDWELAWYEQKETNE